MGYSGNFDDSNRYNMEKELFRTD